MTAFPADQIPGNSNRARSSCGPGRGWSGNDTCCTSVVGVGGRESFIVRAHAVTLETAADTYFVCLRRHNVHIIHGRSSPKASRKQRVRGTSGRTDADAVLDEFLVDPYVFTLEIATECTRVRTGQALDNKRMCTNVTDRMFSKGVVKSFKGGTSRFDNAFLEISLKKKKKTLQALREKYVASTISENDFGEHKVDGRILENVPNTRSVRDGTRRIKTVLNRSEAFLDGYCPRRFFSYTLTDFTLSPHEKVRFLQVLRYLRGAKSRPRPLAQTTRTAWVPYVRVFYRCLGLFALSVA